MQEVWYYFCMYLEVLKGLAEPAMLVRQLAFCLDSENSEQTEAFREKIVEVAEENLRRDRKDFCIDQGWCQAVVVLSGRAAGSQMQKMVEYGY